MNIKTWRGRYQQYDIPATEEVNAGDIRTMKNGERWLVVDCIGYRRGDQLIKYRITIVPDTPANRQKVASMEQGL